MRRRRAAAAVLAVALSLTGCSLREDDGESSQQATLPDFPVEPSGTITQERTRVRVVSGIGEGGGFDPAEIYKRLSPGVVTVSAITGADGKGGLGSGFVLDGNGYVATNAHVVRGEPPALERASSVYVSFADGNRVPAKVVGDDLNADIALLKLNPEGLTLTPLKLGSSRDLVVGSPVAAIGSPFGEDQSLSVGVISAIGRDIDSLTQFQIGNAIQTDAAVNRGNSGGPLLNSRGTVIGINAQIESTGGGGEGVGFAIPIDTVKRSIAQLRKEGRVEYAWLGVSTQELYPQLAERLGFDTHDGALVATVEDGGPADDAGVVAGTGKISFQGQQDLPTGGDAIVGIDGKPVHTAADITNAIATKKPDDEVKLVLLRGDERRSVTVTLGERPDKPLAETEP